MKLATYYTNLLGAIHNAADAMLATMPCPIEAVDFLDAFLDAEDIAVLQRAALLTTGYDTLKSFRLIGAKSQITATIQLPKTYVGRTLLPAEVVLSGPRAGEVEAWLEETADLARDFGRAKGLLEWLYKANLSLEATRHLVPAVLVLLQDSGLPQVADKIAGSGRPARLPSMPPDVRAALRRTNEILAAVSMLDRSATPSTVGKVSLVARADIVHLSTKVDSVDFGIVEDDDMGDAQDDE